ncbi:MAG: cupin domain-containing protein [Floccifex sp.]
MAIIHVRKPNKAQKELLESQPTWSHEVDRWNAEYDDREETFLVIEGKASIILEDGTTYDFEAGDLVTCHPNTKCVWDVKENIKKHYIFDMDPSLE